jgi:hypothetical protein
MRIEVSARKSATGRDGKPIAPDQWIQGKGFFARATTSPVEAGAGRFIKRFRSEQQ